MHYAFTSFSCPNLRLAEALELVAATGYSGFEPRLDRNHAHGIELGLNSTERAEIRRRFEESGVSCCCLALSAQFAEAGHRARALETLPRYLELAADIGCPLLRVFGGPLGEDQKRGESIESMAEGLREAGNEAAEFGIDLALETHDAWCSAADVAAVMTLAGHPNIGVNWDFLHPVRSQGHSIARSFALLRRWIKHVHFHDARITSADGPLQFRSVGEGDIDHAEVLELLFSSRYQGWLSGEWIDWGDADQLQTDLRALREIEMEAGITSL